ncbi:(R)-mandelonitrile lyase [Desulfovibrio litoralis]|uniref:Cupin domain protein n=1 Tax=Desulfovibrio litoralis DSM 11393 TaxID=1121455 RepID=A0A1M7TLJ0_9BACT|nr:cupin domain-containing protein [Desulfovibrio litoralis]SHN71631.1 Cupin domain protein [Desulfovibrio litoralis DSM 11393]
MYYICIKSISFALLVIWAVFSANVVVAESDGTITITRRGTQPSEQMSGSNYTGTVLVEQSFQSTKPAKLVGELLNFEPGARSNWHTSPMGQSILVTSGKMIVQEENGSLEEAFAGDVVTFQPKVKHWFGAALDTGMSAWVIAETVNGTNVNWQEQVNDSQYKNNKTGKQSRQMTITRVGSQPSGKANPKNFSGSARVDGLFTAQNGSNAYGAIVTFEPCSRTDWHSHPMGQTLIITAGRGYVQCKGGALYEVSQGDIVWTPADIVHWHGATADNAMAHIALSERIEGKPVSWGAKVTDEEYGSVNSNEMPLKMQKIALISAFTASGDIDRLKQVLVEGLEAGLTVNQIKEVLIHAYAYAGFPRSLNAINAFITVIDEREKQGIKDVQGAEASKVVTDKSKYEYGHDVLAKLRNPAFVPGPVGSLKRPDAVPRYETFTPAIEVFLKEHLFADVFMRDVLDFQSREIATVGVISNLPGANAQLKSHIGLAMTQGFSEQQMRHLFRVMGTYLGKERGDNALEVLAQTMENIKK